MPHGKKKFRDPGLLDPNPPFTPGFFTPVPPPFTPLPGGGAPPAGTGDITTDTAVTTNEKADLTRKEAMPVVRRDPKTGKITILEIGGRTFLGLSEDEVQQVISGFQGREQKTPEGAVEAPELQLRGELAGQVGGAPGVQQGLQFQEQPLISPLGQVLISDPQVAQGLFAGADIGSAFAAGLGQAAIGAAAIGGIALAAGGVGAIPGAIAGALGGFIRGFTGKLKEDAKQNIAAEFSSLQINSRNMRLLIIDAKTDPDGSLAAFNSQLLAIDEAYTNIKRDSQKDLNKFLGVDAQVEMAKLENFYAPGGFREIYIARMQAVILNPKTDVSDLFYVSDFES